MLEILVVASLQSAAVLSAGGAYLYWLLLPYVHVLQGGCASKARHASNMMKVIFRKENSPNAVMPGVQCWFSATEIIMLGQQGGICDVRSLEHNCICFSPCGKCGHKLWIALFSILYTVVLIFTLWSLHCG